MTLAGSGVFAHMVLDLPGGSISLLRWNLLYKIQALSLFDKCPIRTRKCPITFCDMLPLASEPLVDRICIKTLNSQAMLIQFSKPLAGATVFKRSVDCAINRVPELLGTS